jgi:hypothetical protein
MPKDADDARKVPGPTCTALVGNSRIIWGIIGAISVATIVAYWAAGLSFA